MVRKWWEGGGQGVRRPMGETRQVLPTGHRGSGPVWSQCWHKLGIFRRYSQKKNVKCSTLHKTRSAKQSPRRKITSLACADLSSAGNIVHLPQTQETSHPQLGGGALLLAFLLLEYLLYMELRPLVGTHNTVGGPLMFKMTQDLDYFKITSLSTKLSTIF